jgi:DNA polymerase III subunit epsilon
VTDFEEMAKLLEETGDYRILRRLVPMTAWPMADLDRLDPNDILKLGLVLDVETTGMNQKKDEVIELAMVPFVFHPEGKIINRFETYRRLRQPSIPIPPEITVINGLDDAQVAGHTIDIPELEALVDKAVLIVAHNAGFDRQFAERLTPIFERKAWACSAEQIDWAAEGFEGKKLGYLLAHHGLFYDRHRASEDCAALLDLLSRPLPKSGALTLAKLLDAARRPDQRIWALSSPFETKDALKERGYHWNDGSDGRPKSWHIDVPMDKADEEINWLYKEIYKRPWAQLRLEKITAFTRFSGR